MSSKEIDCFWYPELAICQEDDTPDNNGGDSSTDQEGGKVIDSGAMVELPLNPTLGQTVYLLVSLGQTTAAFLTYLRWRKDTAAGDSFYKVWDD